MTATLDRRDRHAASGSGIGVVQRHAGASKPRRLGGRDLPAPQRAGAWADDRLHHGRIADDGRRGDRRCARYPGRAPQLHRAKTSSELQLLFAVRWVLADGSVEGRAGTRAPSPASSRRARLHRGNGGSRSSRRLVAVGEPVRAQHRRRRQQSQADSTARRPSVLPRRSAQRSAPSGRPESESIDFKLTATSRRVDDSGPERDIERRRGGGRGARCAAPTHAGVFAARRIARRHRRGESPNVGKSSLPPTPCSARRERVIKSRQPGTTRDVLEDLQRRSRSACPSCSTIPQACARPPTRWSASASIAPARPLAGRRPRPRRARHRALPRCASQRALLAAEQPIAVLNSDRSGDGACPPPSADIGYTALRSVPVSATVLRTRPRCPAHRRAVSSSAPARSGARCNPPTLTSCATKHDALGKKCRDEPGARRQQRGPPAYCPISSPSTSQVTRWSTSAPSPASEQ